MIGETEKAPEAAVGEWACAAAGESGVPRRLFLLGACLTSLAGCVSSAAFAQTAGATATRSNEASVRAYKRILSPASLGPRSMSNPTLEANKRLVSRMFLEVVNQKAYDVADEIFAPDFAWPQFNLKGPDGVKAWARAFHAGWPDVKDIVELQIAEGDMVMSLVTVYGTHTGPWLGFQPTGKFCAFPAIGIDRVVNGRIVERAATFNLAEVMRGLGISGLPK